MTAQRSRGEDSAEFESRVRARRPEASDELINRLTIRPRGSRRILIRSLRLAGAVVFVATLAGALAAVGALGYASSIIRQDLIQLKDTVSPGAQTVLNSPADEQYRPGKGCGDKNHIHDRRFECKIAINDVSLKEGNSGTSSEVFTVSLDGSAIDPITLDFATADGTATAPSDYGPTAGTLTFNAGESIKTVTILLVGDAIAEPNETYSVLLSNASPNAVMGDSQGIGTIKNDD